MRSIRKPQIRLGRLGRFPAGYIRVASDSRQVIDQYSHRSQRVIVKVKQSYNNSEGVWKAHGRYIERDKARSGDAFSKLEDNVAVPKTLDGWQRQGDEKLHKIIVSPEYGEQLDLKSYSRDLMAQVEKDLARKLDWVAIVHKNTNNHHVHIALRGVDGDDRVLNIEGYLGHNLRERAQEVVTRLIGPRLDTEILERRQRELYAKRLTDVDRALLWKADDNQIVTLYSGKSRSWKQEARRQQERTRLEFLSTIGVAERISADKFIISPNISETLKRLALRDQLISEKVPGWEFVKTLERSGVVRKKLTLGESVTGRVVAVDIRDPFGDREFMLVDAIDGNTYHFNQPRGARDGKVKTGDVVTFERRVAAGPSTNSTDSLSREFTAVQIHSDWQQSFQVYSEAAETLKGDKKSNAKFPPNLFAKVWREEILRRVDWLKGQGFNPNVSDWKSELEKLNFNSADPQNRVWEPRRLSSDSESRLVVGEVIASSDRRMVVKDVRDGVAKVIELSDVGLSWPPSIGEKVSVEAKTVPKTEILSIDKHIARLVSYRKSLIQSELSSRERKFVFSRAKTWERWGLLEQVSEGEYKLPVVLSRASKGQILRHLQERIYEAQLFFTETAKKQPAWIKFLSKEIEESKNREQTTSRSKARRKEIEVEFDRGS